MCATCGCGDDGAVITLVGNTTTTTTTTTTTHDHDHHHDTRLAHRDDLAGAEGTRQERSTGRAEPEVVGRAQHSGVQRHQLARRRQDHVAGAHHPRAPGHDARSPSSRATRRRCSTPSASAPPVAASVQVNTGAGCHLDAEMTHRALETLRARARLAAVHRERRKPGLPRPVRPRRANKGRGDLGDRRCRQAAQVSAYVRGRRTGDHQ